MTPSPIAWTVNASDSSSGTGLQSDLFAFRDFGVHGCSVATMINAQNTAGTDRSVQLGPDVVEAQFRALAKDLPAGAIKSGDLGMTGIVRALAKYMEQIQAPLVCDPCAATPAGIRKIDPPALEAVRNKLLPRSSLFTPNLIEAEWFSGLTRLDPDSIPEAANRLLQMGAASVLIKGGHLSGDSSPDYWSDGEHRFWLISPRIPEADVIGTGNALAASITACLANTPAISDALVLGKAYVNQGIRMRCTPGKGKALFNYAGFPAQAEDFPLVSPSLDIRTRSFKPLPANIPKIMTTAGTAKQAEELVREGIRCVRFDPGGIPIEKRSHETTAAAQALASVGGFLITVGHQDIAKASGAHGVLLSLEDLNPTTLHSMEESGLLLGIEAYSFFDLAQALAHRPSWVEIPATHGLDAFIRMARFSNTPVLAAAGISVETASDFFSNGAAGAWIDDDLQNALDRNYRIAQWMRLSH